MNTVAARTNSTRAYKCFCMLLMACGAGGLSAFCNTAQATDYSLGFGMNLSARHDDNIRLVKSDKTATTAAVASPSMNFSAASETSSIGLNTIVNLARYNDSGFNSNDINLAGAWNTQFERSSAGINVVAVRDTTTTSELRDSGRIGTTAARHEHYEIAPSWGYAISETDALKLRGSASKDNYGDASYQGYRNWGSTVDWTHSLTEQWRTILRLTYSDYQSDERTQAVPLYRVFDFFDPPIFLQINNGELGTSTQSRSAGGLIGFDYQFSEQNTLTFLTGMSHVSTDYSLKDAGNICSNSALYSPYCSQPASGGNSFNAEIDWNWTGERNSLAFNLSKMDRPSSDGYPLDSWQIDTSWNWRLTELSRLTISASWGRNRISGSTGNSFISQSSNRDYGDAGISYNQNITENWQISASFQYRYQNYTEIDYRADSRVIALAIIYQPTSTHWSR